MELTQMVLESLSQGGVVIRGGLVLAYNSKMLQVAISMGATWKPAVGEPLPTILNELLEGTVSGTVELGDVWYQFSLESVGEDTLLLMEQMQEGTSEQTLSDFLCRLRGDMSLAGVGLEGILESDDIGRQAKVGQLRKSYYSMIRALEHMELLCGDRPREGQSQMELVGYCQRIQMEISPLMKSLGVSVEVVPKSYGLFVKGEEKLLQRLVFGLVANAIQRGGTQIKIRLAKTGDRCKIVVEDSAPRGETGNSPEERLRQEIFAVPDSLDIVTARRLAKELRGSVLVGEVGGTGTRITIALPLEEDAQLTIKSPDVTEGVRYNHLLVEFADVLPSQLFELGDTE